MNLNNKTIIDYLELQGLLSPKVAQRNKLNEEINSLSDRLEELRHDMINLDKKNELPAIVKYKNKFYYLSVMEDDYSDDGFALYVNEETMQDLDNE